jgi:hypothetical protein
MNKKVVVATIHPNNNSERFTEECLRDIVEKQGNESIPVTFDFDKNRVIGTARAISADEGLLCEILIDDRWVELAKKNLVDVFAVPGGIIGQEHMEGDITVYDRITITTISLTTDPADKSLPPLTID